MLERFFSLPFNIFIYLIVMDCLKQTIDQKGYLMYKSNLTEQVNRAVNQIDTMLFAACKTFHIYIA